MLHTSIYPRYRERIERQPSLFSLRTWKRKKEHLGSYLRKYTRLDTLTAEHNWGEMPEMDGYSFGVHVSHLRAESLVDDQQTVSSFTCQMILDISRLIWDGTY